MFEFDLFHAVMVLNKQCNSVNFINITQLLMKSAVNISVTCMKRNIKEVMNIKNKETMCFYKRNDRPNLILFLIHVIATAV